MFAGHLSFEACKKVLRSYASQTGTPEEVDFRCKKPVIKRCRKLVLHALNEHNGLPLAKRSNSACDFAAQLVNVIATSNRYMRGKEAGNDDNTDNDDDDALN